MAVIGIFSLDLRVLRWRLNEEPPADAIGATATATSSPFVGLIKLSTSAFRGTEIDEEETVVLALNRSHLQNLDDYSTTLRMVTAALRYSVPLRFCSNIGKVAVVITEQMYRRYDLRPESLGGEDGVKIVVTLDLFVHLRDDDGEGEIPAADNSGFCDFFVVSNSWSSEDYWGNLRRCVGLGGYTEDEDLWEVEPIYGDEVDGGVTYFEDEDERRQCTSPEP